VGDHVELRDRSRGKGDTAPEEYCAHIHGS
jgi:hypothetical protein